MFVACWSVKGGSGTTVVATALALLLARSSPAGALLVDLGGDAPATLGLPEPTGPGVLDWLRADGDDDALDRLVLAPGDGLRMLPCGPVDGARPITSADGERLAAWLHARHEAVVVDCGPPASAVGTSVAGAAGVSLLVLRPCFLAVRRAVDAPIRPSRVVVVDEPGHALRPSDVAEALSVPIAARIPWDPLVAHRVDAGLLLHGLPRGLERALRDAA